MRTLPLIYREVNDPADPLLPQIRSLYESTLDRSERIPWTWIAHGLGRPRSRSGWKPHLLVAEEVANRIVGYCSGIHLQGFGGYACYLGVAPDARGNGIGWRLFRRLFSAFRRDARRLNEPLPFVLWESHRPRPEDGPEAQANWQTRLRLFASVGAYWIDGVEFRVPNYMDRAAPPVELELFLTPIDTPVSSFGAAELRAVVGELHRRVYGQGPGDGLFEFAQRPTHEPRLRPVAVVPEDG